MENVFKKTWQKLNRDWKNKKGNAEFKKLRVILKSTDKMIERRLEKNGIDLKRLGVILRPTDRLFERKAVLNPACYQEGEFVHIFYRAIDNNNDSTIGYAKLKGPTEVVERKETPLISRNYDYERKGVEDPRITKFG
ncbi:MAG: hypothetical protein ABIJ19_00780, partial [Patescibacteria group bacterium]